MEVLAWRMVRGADGHESLNLLAGTTYVHILHVPLGQTTANAVDYESAALAVDRITVRTARREHKGFAMDSRGVLALKLSREEHRIIEEMPGKLRVISASDPIVQLITRILALGATY